MPRHKSIPAVLLALALNLSGAQADDAAASPAAPVAAVSGVSFTNFNEATLQRVLTNFPKFKSWAATQSEAAKDQPDLSDASALAAYTQGLKGAASISSLETALDQKYADFCRELTQVATAYAAFRAQGAGAEVSDSMKQAVDELKRSLEDPTISPEQRALLQQQMASMTTMQTDMAKINPVAEVPEAALKLVEKFKAPLGQLFGATGEGETPTPSDAPSADQ